MAPTINQVGLRTVLAGENDTCPMAGDEAEGTTIIITIMETINPQMSTV